MGFSPTAPAIRCWPRTCSPTPTSACCAPAGASIRARRVEKTWLYTIALNCLSDHHRRRTTEGRALELVATGPGLESSDERFQSEQSDLLEEIALGEHGEGSERDLLSRSLALLQGPEREAIALRFGADLSIAEIAKLTGEQLTTIEARVYRALRKLRAALS